MTPPRLRGLLVLLPGLFALAVLGYLLLARPEAEATRVLQPAPFLGAPYYGSHGAVSQFDHEYPTYWDRRNCPIPDPNDICGTIWREDGVRLPGTIDICTHYVSCYSGHPALDLDLYYQPVLAAAAGTVTYADWWNRANHKQALGLYVELNHGNGYHTWYGHMSAIIVGQTGGPMAVNREEQIGTSGRTGHVEGESGEHLHFEVQHFNGTDWIPVDPNGWNAPPGTPDPWGEASYNLWLEGTAIPTPPWDTEVTVDDDNLTPVPWDGFGWGCPGGPTEPPLEATHVPCSYWWDGPGAGQGGNMIFTCASIGPTAGGEYWAQWNPPLSSAGYYEVQVYVPSNFATSSPEYLIHYLNGEKRVRLDQMSITNQWISLGTYYFAAGSGGYIRVTDDTGELFDCPPINPPATLSATPNPNNHILVGVDAVRFRHVIAPPPTSTPTNTPTPSPTLPPLTPQVYVPITHRGYAPVPRAAGSYYVSDLSSSTMYDQGCAAGAAGRGDAFVLLDFGPPWADGTTAGTWLYNDTYVSTAQIAVAAEEFLRGYWNCAADSPPALLTLGLGTSNRGVYVTAEHGAAWGALVRDVAAWVDANSYRARVAVAGAWDVEPAGNTAAGTRAWSAAYGTAAEGAALYNVGDAAGCTPAGNCPPGWTPADLYDLSWGAAWAYAVPRIYTRDGAQARQRVALSRFGQSAYGARIHFSGALTQQEACRQGGCLPATDNAPAEGWRQLWAETYRDRHTRLPQLPWSADLRRDMP